MSDYYNRYRLLNTDDSIISPPFIKLDEGEDDEFVRYDVGKTRFDRLSEDYYGSPFYGFLILLANPEFGGRETNILDGQMVRIPMPLKDRKKEYETKLKQRLSYYGN